MTAVLGTERYLLPVISSRRWALPGNIMNVPNQPDIIACMKADRELTELAAIAVNIPLTNLDDRYDCWEADPVLIYRGWNPLVDDTDALQLAASLKMNVDCNGIMHWGRVVIVTSEWHMKQKLTGVIVTVGDNPRADIRRAIVEAAAQIGKSMKP